MAPAERSPATGQEFGARPAPARAEPSASMLPYYGYRLAEGLVRVMPYRTARALASGVADVLLAAVPGRFDGLRSNLRQVLPEVD
ncbi:MAG: hypothetical protein ABR564_04705, partial [Candidatus Dormibacteria bacterium]